MDLSIIIVNWNVRDFLKQCLDSIYRNVTGLSFEVILVDNASSDSSVEMVRERFPHVRIIANTKNAGFCRGNNQGIAASKGEYLVLLNPDTEVEEGALQTLINFAQEHPDVGIVGPMLLYPGGVLMPNGTLFPTLRLALLGATGLIYVRCLSSDLECYGREDFAGVAEVDVVSGACMLVRRRIFEQIGGLDEQLFMFYEEPDFCLRARKAGWHVFYVPQARVFHHWDGVGQSVKQDQIAAIRRQLRSEYLYFRKHHGLSVAVLLRAVGVWALATRTVLIVIRRARNRKRARHVEEVER
jgi:hypothetical protein